MKNFLKSVRSRIFQYFDLIATLTFIPPSTVFSYDTINNKEISLNQKHAFATRCFYDSLPRQYIKHYQYFHKEERGFGERALHSMWFAIFQHCKPRKCLEIGVYRGQIVSLWALLARDIGYECHITAISPFEAVNDNVSRYPVLKDYMSDVMANFDYFNLQYPFMLKLFSTAPKSVSYINANTFDLIYIDGCHDYETVLQDYKNCLASISPGGHLVLDDSCLYTEFKPPSFSFAGHPGPSRVMIECAMKDLEYVGSIGHNSVFRKPCHS